MDFPLESIHKNAFKAAEAARCAGEQGKFWQMHDRLFTNQTSLEPWKPHAEAVGLDVAKFEGCLNAGKYAEAVRKDAADALKAGVSVTPSFFLAYTDPNSSKVKTAVRLTGAQPYAAFKAQIDQLLADQPKAGAAEKPK
jgi:protein-disulfide isomerase